ncbi:MAG: DUF3040 domain-containing protein [Nitriliruptorales bacterium]|nr:DUF3040 domain-containing protein [Nitriliruptorales bacterium]
MGLSEHEQKILDEIERHLAEDDPRFMQRAQRVSSARFGSRRLVGAAVGLVVGLVLLLGLTFHIAFGLAGFAVMFASVVVGATALRQRLAEAAARSEKSDRSSS